MRTLTKAAAAVAVGLAVCGAVPSAAQAQTTGGVKVAAVENQQTGAAERAATLGYGSLGTESVVAPLSTVLNNLWLVLSVQFPNETDLNNVPGSTGSYADTPWFSIGQLVGDATGSLAGLIIS